MFIPTLFGTQEVVNRERTRTNQLEEEKKQSEPASSAVDEDEEMNDLLMCLGQESKRRKRLEEVLSMEGVF